MLVVAIWCLSCVVSAVFGGYAAIQKGRLLLEGVLFGLFLGPLGVIAVACLPNREAPAVEEVEPPERHQVDVDQWDFSTTLAGPRDARMPNVKI